MSNIGDTDLKTKNSNGIDTRVKTSSKSPYFFLSLLFSIKPHFGHVELEFSFFCEYFIIIDRLCSSFNKHFRKNTVGLVQLSKHTEQFSFSSQTT